MPVVSEAQAQEERALFVQENEEGRLFDLTP